jgi:uncharacterized protein
MSTSTLWQKVVRGIGVTLAALATIGLVISSFPMALFTPRTTPPQENSSADFPANFQFEIASTTESRAQGLSGRSEVPPNYGMLFVFGEPGLYGMWMKDMLVPIDIVWLDEAGTVIGVQENISPDTYPETFYPPQPASYALETRPGEVKAQGFDIGDVIPLP